MEQDELFNISNEQLSDLEKTASDLDLGVKSESENAQNSESSESFDPYRLNGCLCGNGWCRMGIADDVLIK